MIVTFFAVRPMLSAIARVDVNKAAFLRGLTVSYIPRKRNPFRTSGFYNVFTLTAPLSRYSTINNFATMHSFLLLGASFGNNAVLLDFAKSVFSFSLLEFFPAGLLKLNLRLFLLPLICLLRLSFFGFKTRLWLQ
jgi:hypothetical protein